MVAPTDRAARSSGTVAFLVVALVLLVCWGVVSLILRNWWMAAIAGLFVIALAPSLRIKPALLAVEVGDREHHQVVSRFNQFWGNLSVSVDGRRVISDFRMYSLRLAKTYTLQVGTHEVHTVRFEKIRPVVAAGIRPQQVTAYVDGVLVAQTAT